MKKYSWLIIEYNFEYVEPWEYIEKKHKRFAKKMVRQLSRHCGSESQYVLVKVRGE